MSRVALMDVALGRLTADTVVLGGTLVNVATAEIYRADVADQGRAHRRGRRRRLHAGRRHGDHRRRGALPHPRPDRRPPALVPQLPRRRPSSPRALLRHGVTATADGFYGQGIVGGMEAIRFFKQAFERMPLRLIFLVPILSYLQNRELGLTPANGIEPRRDDQDARLARLLRRRGAAVPADRREVRGVPRPVRGDARARQGHHRATRPASTSARCRRTRRWAPRPTTRWSAPDEAVAKARAPASSC